MTSIYLPREDSLGRSGGEFQLEEPGCVLLRNILISAAVTASASSTTPSVLESFSISLLAWAKKKENKANEMLLYLV